MEKLGGLPEPPQSLCYRKRPTPDRVKARGGGGGRGAGGGEGGGGGEVGGIISILM